MALRALDEQKLHQLWKELTQLWEEVILKPPREVGDLQFSVICWRWEAAQSRWQVIRSWAGIPTLWWEIAYLVAFTRGGVPRPPSQIHQAWWELRSVEWLVAWLRDVVAEFARRSSLDQVAWLKGEVAWHRQLLIKEK